MKKIALTIASLAFLITVSKAQEVKKEKAFKKGDITIDLGAGFDLYATQINQEIYGTKFDTTDGSGGANFPLKVEYGITNWLGVGARFAYSSFIDETDSITGYKNATSSYDAGIVVNFHLVKSKRFDMPISLTYGYSHLSIKSNDSIQSAAKGGGTAYGISLLPRIYFGEHIGMYFNVGYMGYSYPNIIYSNKYESNLNEAWGDAKVGIKGNGVNLGIGLIVKF